MWEEGEDAMGLGLRGFERLLTGRNFGGLELGLGTRDIGEVWKGELRTDSTSFFVKGP